MNSRARRPIAGLALTSLMACAPSVPQPAAFDAANEPCRYCRMVGSDGRFAAELVAPREEPVWFDDIGCLANYLATAASLAPGTVAYVADHRTREWVPAATAVYAMDDSIATPMNSHLVAHASTASRAADEDVRATGAIPIDRVFAPGRLPGGTPR